MYSSNDIIKKYLIDPIFQNIDVYIYTFANPTEVNFLIFYTNLI